MRYAHAFATSLGVLGLLYAQSARAQVNLVEQQPPQQQPPPSTVVQPVQPVAPAAAAPVGSDVHGEETTTPNRGLIITGALMFGVPYLTSAVVAAESGHDGDSHLAVPIVGPWIDLGTRGGCPPGNVSCDTETTNKVLLVADGILQGVGVLEILGGFLYPEKHVKERARPVAKEKPTITVAPSHVGYFGYGMAAAGTF